MRVATVLLATDDVVWVKVELVAFPGMKAGPEVAADLLLVTLTVTPLGLGDLPTRYTVPVDWDDPVMLVGLYDKANTAGCELTPLAFKMYKPVVRSLTNTLSNPRYGQTPQFPSPVFLTAPGHVS